MASKLLSISNSDLKYLKMTIPLAQKAQGKTSPNPMVGAIIVKNNRMISQGFHKKCGSAHAEINALTKAGKSAKNAVLYVNLEPCNHYGRTPPCTQAIIKAGIKKVIIAMRDPNPLTSGQGIKKLRKHNIKVLILKENKEFMELNKLFIKYITKKIPWVIFKTAQSVDGKIATNTKQSKWITGKEARTYAQSLRHQVDAILVGVNTVLKDNPSLSARYKNKIKQDKPVKIILDSTLKISGNRKIFSKNSPAPVIIATTKKASLVKLKKISKKARVLICPMNKQGRIDLIYLLKKLAALEISSLLIEGGGSVGGAFFDAKLIDEVYFFIAPEIIGGIQAISSVGGKGISDLAEAIELDNTEIINLGKDFLVKGKVQYSV
ncbi:MAG: bifunctional diaminohydroxyphosphoribosylaminopyrimidine deaminase/5-amino-6-(5-phosphoribosylamino)uracil reductase RibD [Candidatus Omnitrophota bacterium]